MRRNVATFDSESLQADVMRFMAIIAFCLIAILALVKNIDDQVAMQEVVAVVEPVDQSVVVEKPQQKDVEPVVPDVVEPVVEAPVRKARPVPVEQYSERPVTATVARTVVEVKEAMAEKPPEVKSESSEPEPLALAFANESAFLSLIGSGAIQLVVKQASGYVHMGADLVVNPGAVPGNLYELYRSSVPESMLRLISAGRSDILFVSLGDAIDARLGKKLKDPDVIANGGNLVISKNGEVNYEHSNQNP